MCITWALVNGKQVRLPSLLDGPRESRAAVSDPDLGRSDPCCSIRRLGGLFLQDDAGTTISAEVWKDCPGWATARVETYSCETTIKIYFFRLRVGDRVEFSNLLTELARRVATLDACGRLEDIISDQAAASSTRYSVEQHVGLNVEAGRPDVDVGREVAR